MAFCFLQILGLVITEESVTLEATLSFACRVLDGPNVSFRLDQIIFHCVEHQTFCSAGAWIAGADRGIDNGAYTTLLGHCTDGAW